MKTVIKILYDYDINTFNKMKIQSVLQTWREYPLGSQDGLFRDVLPAFRTCKARASYTK